MSKDTQYNYWRPISRRIETVTLLEVMPKVWQSIDVVKLVMPKVDAINPNLLCLDHFGQVVNKVLSVGQLYIHLAKPSRLFVIATLMSRRVSNIVQGQLYPG